MIRNFSWFSQLGDSLGSQVSKDIESKVDNESEEKASSPSVEDFSADANPSNLSLYHADLDSAERRLFEAWEAALVR